MINRRHALTFFVDRRYLQRHAAAAILVLICTASLTHAGTIKGISIVGERHTGTNFVLDLLKATLDHRNSDRFNVGDWVCGWRPTESPALDHRHKHRFQFPDFNTCNLTEHLIIVMLRNPFDWTLSMKKYCWCRGTNYYYNPFEKTSLGSFTTDPWIKDFLSAIPPINKSYTETTFLGQDRKPGPFPFDNILHLRACKLQNQLDISSWAPNVVYLHHEDTLDHDVMWKWLRGLVHNYTLPRRTNYTSEPALTRAFGPDAPKSLVKIWKYIDGDDETAVPGFTISYLGSMGKIHQQDAGSHVYDPKAARLKSVWSNYRQLVANNSELLQHVMNVNRLMYRQVEERAGYHQLDMDGLEESGLGTKEGSLGPKPIKCGW